MPDDAHPQIASEPASIQASLNYLRDTGGPVFTESVGKTNVKTGGEREPHVMTILNGRPRASEFSLDREGFAFGPHLTRMQDFFDPDELKRTYYPEMEALVKAGSGAHRVVVFDHTLRTADEQDREARQIREVVQRVHNDYTDWSGPQRLKDVLPDEAETLLRRRFAIIQVWRPIRKPVESYPLAIMDAQTLKPGNLVISERRYPGRVGQTYAITHDPGQRWYWFPRMRRDEALVFKVYNSETDGRARWSAHTSFEDPTSPPDAAPRESIEIRTLAFF